MIKKKPSGLSPIIGILLLVAVTLSLVTLLTIAVFNINVVSDNNPDASVELTNNDGSVEATVLRNENVKSFKLQYENSEDIKFDGKVSNKVIMKKGSGTYKIIAIMEDGSEFVINKKEFNDVKTSSGEDEDDDNVDSDNINKISGSVKDSDGDYLIGATVKALDSDGNVIETDETDCSGKYSFNVDNIQKINVIKPESSDYCLDGSNDDEGSTIADFEGGSLPSDWTDTLDDDNDPKVSNSRSYSGSYSLETSHSGYDGEGEQSVIAKWQPDVLKDGEAVKELSFRWYEARSSYGTAWSLRDDKGNRIMAVSTNNPEAEYYDPDSGDWEKVDFGGDYYKWHKFTLDIDYENSEYDLIFEQADGTTSTVDNIPFDKKSLTYEFTMHKYTGGSYGGYDTYTYIDDVEIKY